MLAAKHLSCFKNYCLKKVNPFILSLLSGILLWAAWPESYFTFLIFIAWIPLLFVADVVEKKIRFFFLCFISMLTWNAATTWWIWNSTDVGSIGAIVCNSLLMTLPWWAYRTSKRKLNKKNAYISLIAFWMLFEYIHLNWQLSWPWLTLGNVFADKTAWVQWYEYTGTSGGTLWILIVNILLFDIIKNIQPAKPALKIKETIIAALIILLPIIISVSLKSSLNTAQTTLNKTGDNVIIVQPNIDPYGKFSEGSTSQQIQILLSLSEQQLDSNTKLVVWPETALSETVWQDEIKNDAVYQPVFAFVNRHPGITLLTGIETYKKYGAEKTTPTAQFDETDNIYYDAFNAAVAIHAGDSLQFYNKSKLVPGVETLPGFLRWLSPLFEKFGGTTGGYGHSDQSAVFKTNNNPYTSAPIICYESIYGEYISTYVQKGANILTIITNDGWWGNTPGHIQHLNYARLRAIETRKWVVRSANTGISAVINEAGDILETQPWNKAAFIKANVSPQEGETFYVKYGDVLSKIASGLGLLFLLWNIITVFKKK